MEYKIIDISGCDQDLFEQLGTKAKFWFYDGDERTLFKSTVTEDKDGRMCVRPGEDWSEKIACEIAKLIGIPAANYELAINDSDLGVVSYYMVPDECELIHGNQLLVKIGSVSDDNKVQINRKSHTIGNIHSVLEIIGCRKPIGYNSFSGVKEPFDFFLGYLMLDVLIGNQDRHEENWAVVRAKDGVWQDSKTILWLPVAKLTRTEYGYRFNYTRGAENKNFKPFVFMDKLSTVYEGKELPPFFANRILSKDRPEFKKIISWSDLFFDGDNYLEILGRTGGGRVTDDFRIIPCPVENEGCYSLKFFVNGIRHLSESQRKAVDALVGGDRLEFVKDDGNEYDSMALRIENGFNIQIGYCPRYLAPEFRKIMSGTDIQGYSLKVSKSNPDAPSAFKVLCEFSSQWPKDHLPMIGDEYLACD